MTEAHSSGLCILRETEKQKREQLEPRSSYAWVTVASQTSLLQGFSCLVKPFTVFYEAFMITVGYAVQIGAAHSSEIEFFRLERFI